MEITKRHIQSLKNNVQKVVDQLSALEEGFEPDIEEGQYWEYEDSGKIIRINSKEETVNDYRIDGTIINTTANRQIYPYESNLKKYSTLLSDDEVGQALIEGAERRGFVCNYNNKIVHKPIQVEDVSVQWDGDEPTEIRDSDREKALVGSVWHYDSSTDTLINSGFGGVNAVYHKGDWAEIVEEWKVEHTLGDKYAVVKDNKKIGQYYRYESKISGFNKEEAEEIRDALNNMED